MSMYPPSPTGRQINPLTALPPLVPRNLEPEIYRVKSENHYLIDLIKKIVDVASVIFCIIFLYVGIARVIYKTGHKILGYTLFPGQLFTKNKDNQVCIDLQKKKLIALYTGKPLQLITSDGIEIDAMHFPGKTTMGANAHPNAPTIIFFHDNKQPYADKENVIKNYVERGLNILCFDYRGFTQSSGYTSCQGAVLDGEAAFNYVHKELKVAESKIVLHMHSSGVGPGLRVANNHPYVNVCVDRGPSSYIEWINQLAGKGFAGMLSGVLFGAFGWEYPCWRDWKAVKGYKWIIHHEGDTTIPRPAQMITALKDDPYLKVLTLDPTGDDGHNRPLNKNEWIKQIALAHDAVK